VRAPALAPDTLAPSKALSDLGLSHADFQSDRQEYGRLLLFYKTRPKSVEEEASPKGALMLRKNSFEVSLVDMGGRAGKHMRIDFDSDPDGFIDAGEMRNNYVFAAGSEEGEERELENWSAVLDDAEEPVRPKSVSCPRSFGARTDPSFNRVPSWTGNRQTRYGEVRQL